MLLCASKFIGRRRQKRTCNFTFLGCDGQQNASFERDNDRVCSRFDGKRVLCGIGPAKQLSREIKRNDAAGSGLVGPTGSDGTADHQEHVIGRVAFTYDYVVARVANRAALQGTKSAI